MKVNDWPTLSTPLSQSAVSLVLEWIVGPLLVHCTDEPTGIVTVCGWNAKSTIDTGIVNGGQAAVGVGVFVLSGVFVGVLVRVLVAVLTGVFVAVLVFTGVFVRVLVAVEVAVLVATRAVLVAVLMGVRVGVLVTPGQVMWMM